MLAICAFRSDEPKIVITLFPLCIYWIYVTCNLRANGHQQGWELCVHVGDGVDMDTTTPDKRQQHAAGCTNAPNM